MNQKLIRPGQVVVDLGATPGSWSQYVRNKLSEKRGRNQWGNLCTGLPWSLLLMSSSYKATSAKRSFGSSWRKPERQKADLVYRIWRQICLVP
jgi:hypothetical protein